MQRAKQSPDEASRLDRTVATLVVATLVALYIFLVRVLEGSWSAMLGRVTGVLVPMAIYFGLIAAIAMVSTRRGADTKRWWFLLLLPLCGAIAGVAARAVGTYSGTMMQGAVAGVGYGALHALLLRWSWRSADRQSRVTTA
jgi:hypothetical protein